MERYTIVVEDNKFVGIKTSLKDGEKLTREEYQQFWEEIYALRDKGVDFSIIEGSVPERTIT